MDELDDGADDPLGDAQGDASDVEVSDAELTELALAADPDAPIPALLPGWFMPVPMGARRSGRTRRTVGLIVTSLLALNAAGLCVTYGVVELAW